jgi:hypothetical protein
VWWLLRHANTVVDVAGVPDKSAAVVVSVAVDAVRAVGRNCYQRQLLEKWLCGGDGGGGDGGGVGGGGVGGGCVVVAVVAAANMVMHVGEVFDSNAVTMLVKSCWM